ncbi:uncharacterized protein LOC111615058 [Centruroides sculpturatus]|uniref:uncharacterized protein LOC111615058 n=1 Tax=Centruroides sculpturatus TaxID=218467 RepID=UPI000C6DDFB5|nr:uncharacterized protein LOC111615058 [Centruroides sculpturatus]
MVHETTEYRRKYRWNSPQKRHQIWKENWNFRKARKLLEFQHEPFDSWNEEQSSESSVTDEIANEFLPPSKLKQKYLEVIKETTNHSKIHMIDRATSPEYCPSLSESLLSEKNKCDVGVQTPNWDDLKYESDKDSDREMYIENDLLEIARRLKEGVMCNVNTLDFINQVINRARSSSPPRKKDTRDSYSHLLRDKHQTHQSKSPISLCSQINKQKDI